MDELSQTQKTTRSMRLQDEDGDNEDRREGDAVMDMWDQEEAEFIEEYKLELLSRRPYLKVRPVLGELLVGDLSGEDPEEASRRLIGMTGEE